MAAGAAVSTVSNSGDDGSLQIPETTWTAVISCGPSGRGSSVEVVISAVSPLPTPSPIYTVPLA